MARDAVEERAERAARRETHVLGGLVHEQLQHDQLAHRHARHPLREPEGVRLERVVRHHLEHEPDVGRRPGGDLVAGEQIALRALEPEAVDPHRRGRRAPDARRRVPEARTLGGDDEIGAEYHVRPATDAPALDRCDRRLPGVPELQVGLDEAPHHLKVADGVPRAPRPGFPGRALCRLRVDRPVQAVAGAEGRPVGAEQDHVDVAVGVGLVDCGGKLVAQRRRDRVVLRSAAEHDRSDAVGRLGAEGPGHRTITAPRCGPRDSRSPPRARPARRASRGTSGIRRAARASGRRATRRR